MKLEIVLEQEEDGTYSVHCPALKGCHSQGERRGIEEYSRSHSIVSRSGKMRRQE